MVGQKFKTQNCGDVIVTQYTNCKNVTICFIDTGTTLKTKKEVLLRSDRPRFRDPLAKTVFGVGCIGVGEHKAHTKEGADTKAYSIWRAMLRRCYYRGSKHHQRSYEGITVCEEWLNFQTFAEWFEENYPTDGKRCQLDKDVITPGNKVYSPKTCSFVTQQENLAARRYRRK
jgi:hypothetical protein